MKCADARRITRTSLGLLHYSAPRLHVVLGVVVSGEQRSPTRCSGLCLIWLALVLYSGEGLLHGSRTVPLDVAAREGLDDGGSRSGGAAAAQRAEYAG
jgi:chloramphenicol-sensitive protein RarD